MTIKTSSDDLLLYWAEKKAYADKIKKMYDAAKSKGGEALKKMKNAMKDTAQDSRTDTRSMWQKLKGSPVADNRDKKTKAKDFVASHKKKLMAGGAAGAAGAAGAYAASRD
jgi:hypothetical protein